jgi:hypothetical protein
LGIEKSYLLTALKITNEKPNEDYQLSFSMTGEMNFFRDKENASNWGARLDYFEQIGTSQSPIFEAVFCYGKWKQEKDYQFILQSLSNFEKMEKIANEKKWFWVLSLCITEQINICFEIENNEKLKTIAQRIVDYLKERKEVFKPHTFMELTREFIRLLGIVENEPMKQAYILVADYLQSLPLDFSFQEGFLNACLAIKKAQKDEEIIRALHRQVLNLKLKKAEEKGKSSKLLLSGFLDEALAYCVKYVNDKALTIEIKKRLQNIDLRDEFQLIELPEDELKKFNEANEKYGVILKEAINDYVNGLKHLHPIQILYKLANDESLFRMRINNTRKFVNKLMDEHPVQDIFGFKVYFEHRNRKLKSREEKINHELNTQLSHYLRENIWVISQIFIQILKEEFVNIADIYFFLKNCATIDRTNFSIIMNGLLKHLSAEYLSSISILTPKIESAIYEYLLSINADVSCYANESISKRMLGGLIEQPEIAKNFSVDFQYFLKLLLITDDSINFRNRFAHGEVKIEEFNETLSSIILFILIKLCGKTIEFPKEPQNANK